MPFDSLFALILSDAMDLQGENESHQSPEQVIRLDGKDICLLLTGFVIFVLAPTGWLSALREMTPKSLIGSFQHFLASALLLRNPQLNRETVLLQQISSDGGGGQ